MDAILYGWRWLNEATLRPAAVVLNLAVRVPSALYGGLRAVIADGAPPLASIIAGSIVAILLLVLLVIGASAFRKLRLKNPAPAVIRAGAGMFWIGCAIGANFLGLTVYGLVLHFPLRIVGLFAGTTILYPAVGRGIQYVLGR